MSNKQVNIISFAIAFAIHSGFFLFRSPALESHTRISSTAINLSLESIPANNTASQQKKAVSPPKREDTSSAIPKPDKKDTADDQTINPMSAENLPQEKTGETGVEPQLAASSPAALDINNYLSLIRSQIEKHKYYPRFSRKQNHEGTSLIKIDIAKDGSIMQVTLLSSSGYKTLDKAALEAIRQSSPFPAPSEYGLRELSLDIPVTYMIR